MASWVDDASSNETAIITCFVAVFVVVYFAWNENKSSKANAKLPPGPRGLPVVGYLPFLGTTDLHKTFTELSGVYGPIFKIWLGNKLCAVVSSPALVKQVLRKLFVSKMMSNATLDACYALRKQEVKNTIRDLYNNNKDNIGSGNGKPIDVGELSISTLVRVMQNMLWGQALETREKEITNLGANLAELMVLLGTPNISDIFPVLSWLDMQGIERRAEKISLWFENIINSGVEQYRNKFSVVKGEEAAAGKNIERSRNKDFLRLLLELQENEDSASSISMPCSWYVKQLDTKSCKITAIYLREAASDDIIVAGTDTTTTMVEWTMAELMQHPQVMKKVQEELAQVVGMDSCVEEYHLPKVKYLDAVVKETFRLHPALPLLVPRTASQNSNIGGYTIPNDTNLMLNVWAIHRDPQLWDNPLDFRPERFLNDDIISKFNYSGNNFQYLPFGSGRRMCAGIALAERMLMLVLASLLHLFEWKLPPGTKLDLSEKYGIVMRKKEPLIAIPTPRLPNSDLYQ
ncbi:hypothetical protein CICLE_v10017705mg [Citrus x clementina]|uniref:Cytochrome P450 n=1 Tax=Citrus clementina TaxID=85681 RepID=V4U5B1_CITCL|nr:hypothetical protein CICLE_v10017705mg [Citrus x clementina]